MSTITSSGTLTYNSASGFSYDGNYAPSGSISFPIMITNTTGSTLTVTFGSDLTLANITDCFIVSSDNVTIDGGNYVVTVPALYTGLVQNGTSSAVGFSNCALQNIGLKTSGTTDILYNGITQDYFGKVSSGISTCSITNCNVNAGNISNSSSDSSFYGGGIGGKNNYATINNCYVIVGGYIFEGGGIAGRNNGGDINNCYSIVGGDYFRRQRRHSRRFERR